MGGKAFNTQSGSESCQEIVRLDKIFPGEGELESSDNVWPQYALILDHTVYCCLGNCVCIYYLVRVGGGGLVLPLPKRKTCIWYAICMQSYMRFVCI